MGKSKRGQKIVLETNVKILIVFIVIGVVLSGIFFFGDKFLAWYDNLVPKNDVPDLPDDQIYEERESYNLVVPEKIEGKMTVQELSFADIRYILLFHTILEVRRDGKTIVRSNFDSGEDPDPKTKRIEFLFDKFWDKNDVRVESVYDAERKKVVSKYFLGDSADFSYLVFDRCNPSEIFVRMKGIFPQLTEKERMALSRIVCAGDRDSFASQIVEAVNNGHCKIKIGNKFIKKIFGDSVEDQKDEVLKMLLNGRENYISSWDSDGFLNGGNINKRYSCDFGNGDFVLCVPSSYNGFLKMYPSDEEVSEIEYQTDDEVFYFKDEEIWRIKYPDLDKLGVSGSKVKVENSCVSSVRRGRECR